MKKLFALGIWIIFASLLSQKANAQDFDISTNIEYEFDKQGMAAVEHNVTITNLKEFIHAPDYTVTLNVAGIEEMQVTGSDGTSIPFTVNDTQHDGKKIKLVFPDRIVGEGTTQAFILRYKTSTLANRLGNSWELNIPSVAGNDTATNVEVTVPQAFGEASILKPQDNISINESTYTFPPNSLDNEGAVLIFGNEEFYRLKLAYTLENANLFPLRTEIALPPKTQYQDVVYEKIDPKPQRITVDEDGNYLAQYSLSPHEKKNVKAEIVVKVTSHTNELTTLTDKQISEYTSRQKYWEQSADISEISQTHKTPEEIFNYIVENFTYNHTRTTNQNTRLGAQLALSQPDNLVCLEFTDMFVALARSAGIPARSVEGYAYTQNQQTRPRSLVRDVLHAWPEYYDRSSKKWIAVDPTWGNTTGGIDYFNTLDLAHIAFIRKGQDSEYPIPAGGYKRSTDQKQVSVEFAQEKDFNKNEKVSFSVKPESISNPFTTANAVIEVHNTGNSVIDNRVLSVQIADSAQEFTINNLPPYATFKVTADTKENALTKKSHQITMQLGDSTVTQTLVTGVDRQELALYIGGPILGAIIFAISIKVGSIYISRRRK